jgi:hypothetical protein
MSSFIKATVKSKRYKKDLRRSVSLSQNREIYHLFRSQPPQAPGDSSQHRPNWCMVARLAPHFTLHVYLYSSE